ncbi:efflux RND transporter permease subunit [Desulfobacterales bacterium HSG16]|nr:efflux RND transporter permease subunit [Desulfobacterales bacterium HSG16]
MDIISISIKKPVTVVAMIVLVALFGIISLLRLPYQLSPTVIEPEISVSTSWRGAAPYEIEREIVEEQENVLKSLPGLVEMESDSANGSCTVTMRFSIGTDIDDALLRVSSKLNEVGSYPDGADNPVINATGAATSPVVWIIFKTVGDNPRSIVTYRTYFDEEIKQHMDRIKGVASLMVGGGTEKELHIIIDPEKLAALGITIKNVIDVLKQENVNTSVGNLGVGRRDYRIRTTAEFKTRESINEVVIKSTGQRRILIKDVAEVRHGFEKGRAVVIHNGTEGIAIGFRPEHGANVLDMTDRIREVVNHLNETRLKPKNLELVWVADQTPYIRGAISIIKQNIIVGGILAIIVLLIFVRSFRATVIVSTSIPVSIIGTFIFMDLFKRNLNVVSLAGIAFAVGMLVDSAIVVIENIDRHRKMGKPGVDAAYDGTKEVWGAIVASTLTTIAVFLPVVFLKGEVGQLFKDIAIAVVFAITLSMFVSVSVIPMFAASLFGKSEKKDKKKKIGIFASAGNAASSIMMRGVSFSIKNWATRLITVGTLVALAAVSVYILLPKMEYLPQGNRNFVMSYIVPPPGLSHEERKDIGAKIFKRAAPYIKKDSHNGFPGILNMFFVGRSQYMFIGAMCKDWTRAGELVPLFKSIVKEIPGMYGVAMQVGIFQTRLARGRTVDIDISGADIDTIVKKTGMLFVKIRKAIPGAQVRPVPSIELMYPEINIIPDRDRLRANNMSSRELGIALDVLMDGRGIGDFKEEGKKKIDLVLKTADEDINVPEDLFSKLVVTPAGKAVPVSSLAKIQHTAGITQIRHLERNRTFTLQVTPPLVIPLESAMETIKKDVTGPLLASGMLKGVDLRMSGAAGKLTVARSAMQWNFVLAAVIAYLLMASLFGNFVYPLIIMLTVPLAGAGGFMGLWLLNHFITPQPMDILTMLGFVILIGVVVNNAILIVHQAINNVRDSGMSPEEAVLESTRSRLRPIYMSATTSIFGMLPLVIVPGAGTELYKGLGSVILGGIAVSTVFTVFVIPSILMFVIKREKPKSIA